MNDHPDVCVIGAGPAGAILAAELAQRGHEVYILDAGPRFDPADREERMERYLRPAFDREDVWDMGGDRDAFTLSGSISYDLNTYRVKGIGGSTLHWRATTPRLHPEDFEMATRYGLAEDWPISYADLAEYYYRAEQELGVAGESNPHAAPRDNEYPQPAHPPSQMDALLSDAFEAVGAPLHAYPRAINSIQYDGRNACAGYGTCSPVCPERAKYSADVHVDRAESAGATVIDRAPVQSLHHDESGTQIVDAVYRRDGESHRIEADEFVIAAGGVESARLLLLSASDQFPDGVANSSGYVGKCFTEHPMVGLAGRLDEPTGSDQIGFETSMSEAFYAHDRGPTGSMIVQVENRTGHSPPEAALDRQPHTSHFLHGNPTGPIRGDAFGDELLQRVTTEYQHRVRIEAMVEHLPDPDNTVSLDDTRTDVYGNPVPDIDYSLGSDVRATLERAQSLLHDIFEEAGVTEIEPIGSPPRPHFVSHHMGTTRMGSDPNTSVVNPQLRTHDLANLWISSSGTFVTFGAAPPTLTIAALTLRLADHLDTHLSG